MDNYGSFNGHRSKSIHCGKPNDLTLYCLMVTHQRNESRGGVIQRDQMIDELNLVFIEQCIAITVILKHDVVLPRLTFLHAILIA